MMYAEFQRNARVPGRLLRYLSPALCLILGGCAAIGVVAAKLAPPVTVQPKYHGLAGQSIAVMVWADAGIANDYPALQLDIANSIQQQLQNAQANVKDKEAAKTLAGAQFPYPPASVVRFQSDHPDVEGLPVTEIAPRLSGVTRLIYVELDNFQTRPEASVELFRGSISANIKIVEVANGKGKIGYEEAHVSNLFPEKSPAEGMPNVQDKTIYIGTVNAFGTSVTHRLVPYQVDPN